MGPLSLSNGPKWTKSVNWTLPPKLSLLNGPCHQLSLLNGPDSKWTGLCVNEGLSLSTSINMSVGAGFSRCSYSRAQGRKSSADHNDVDKAFTHSDMDYRVIMEQPHGFSTPGKVDQHDAHCSAWAAAAWRWLKTGRARTGAAVQDAVQLLEHMRNVAKDTVDRTR